jgi:hypothetical protein
MVIVVHTITEILSVSAVGVVVVRRDGAAALGPIRYVLCCLSGLGGATRVRADGAVRVETAAQLWLLVLMLMLILVCCTRLVVRSHLLVRRLLCPRMHGGYVSR